MRNIFFIIFLFSALLLSAQNQIIWNPATPVSSSSHGNNHPRVVTDGSGSPLIIWYHENDAMFSRWNGTSFETPRALNPSSMELSGASWTGPDIASKGDTVYVVFKEKPEHIGHIWCIHSFDGGITFSGPVQVDFIEENLSRFPIVTIDDSGNPIIAFMKFDEGFSEARWVVTRSNDFGSSFSDEVLASGWSSATSDVCDCCPGTLVSSENTVAMLYRDNNSNLRDTWAGVSTNGGLTFSEGINVDQHQWMIMACPASGPDGVILGDTLYTTYMNGAGGKSKVYYNRTSLSDVSSSTGIPLANDNSDIQVQNFPRISGDKNALGIVWKQVVNGKDQCVIRFTPDISQGLPAAYDTVDLEFIMNADIAISNGNVYVVWEDYNSGTLQFRSGSYSETTSIDHDFPSGPFLIYPNPSSDSWNIRNENSTANLKIELFDICGHLLHAQFSEDGKTNLVIDNAGLQSGIYILKLSQQQYQYSFRLIKN